MFKSITARKQYTLTTHPASDEFKSGKLTPAEIQRIAAARAVREVEIDASAEREGYAAREVRCVMGVVGKSPGKRRQATSGCGPNGRKFHDRLTPLPAASATPSAAPLPVIIGGRTSKGQPFAGSIVVKGLMSKVKRAVAKREKLIEKIIAGKK